MRKENMQSRKHGYLRLTVLIIIYLLFLVYGIDIYRNILYKPLSFINTFGFWESTSWTIHFIFGMVYTIWMWNFTINLFPEGLLRKQLSSMCKRIHIDVTMIWFIAGLVLYVIQPIIIVWFIFIIAPATILTILYVIRKILT